MNIQYIVYSLVDVGHILQAKATSLRLFAVPIDKNNCILEKKIEETHRLRMIENLWIDNIKTKTIRIKDDEILNQ